MPKRPSPAAAAERELRSFSLSLPGTREEFPWGERVIKVQKKVFVFMGHGEGGLGLSVKLAQTAAAALTLPFTEPTGYGLGKAGWVSARFQPEDGDPPVEMLKQWILESYRAVAPKKLVAELDGGSRTFPARPARRAAGERRSATASSGKGRGKRRPAKRGR